ncbi:glucose-1-phosphate adenylyltransferase subunit GlgD [Dendrosporobacter sp. 1207_IL3150]|uniref:glucose-1-phosphate adenylyltransferase subunit GlgD n=1 Tax=Dendrosporobacter sp. 1207_IL3150 TaxID=3084054 RepID=UPI002FD89D56
MDAMGIINLYNSKESLAELTLHRPLAAVPFAGRYRLIDFPLSNMVNSGISSVGIMVHNKYRSLMDHLRSGKEWDLARKRDGLAILPPAYANHPEGKQLGDIENFHSNLDYISHSRNKYVVIAGASMVYNIDLTAVIKFHETNKADITAVYSSKEQLQDGAVRTLLRVDSSNRIIDMQVKSGTCPDNHLSMDLYIMERKLLVDLIENCAARGDYDFVKHCLIKNIGNLKMFGFKHQGYLAHISSTQSYFKHTMELLKPEIWEELFFTPNLIYTKVKDEPPAKYKAEAIVVNSLVANGCYIEGRVENSILFRGVRVEKGAYIKDCIIMQKGLIASGTTLQNVICDKDVQIQSGRSLKGEPSYPIIIKKGMVI